MEYIKKLNVFSFSAICAFAFSTTALAGEVGCTANQISGFAFRDFNSNGIVDSFEVGAANITVTATSSTGATQTTTTDSAGFFSFNTSEAQTHRIELSSLSSDIRFGFANNGGASDVRFVAPGNCGLEFAISAPAEFCSASGEQTKLASTRFINGDGSLGGSSSTFDTVVSFDSQATGLGMAKDALANNAQVGSVWGLGYARTTKKLYASAFMKRHAGFGPLGASGIYSIDISNPASPALAPFVRLEDLGFSAGVDPRSTGDLPADASQPSVDSSAWEKVAKMSFGDLELSEDESKLFVSNLFDNAVYEIRIPSNGTTPTAADVTRYPVQNPGCSFGDYAIGAVRNYRSDLYVGVVCTGETSQSKSDLQGFVLKWNGVEWTTFFNFPLHGFDRGFNLATNIPVPGNPLGPVIPSVPDYGGKWQPWKPTFISVLGGGLAPSFAFYSYPQALLSNIEFTEQGELILALLDRSAQQYGSFNFSPISLPALGLVGFEHCASAGDLMMACPDSETGTLSLESNGRCGIRQAGLGAGNNQGPGGGELFTDDFSFFPGYTIEAHQETYLGAAAYRAGSNEIIATAYNVDQESQENGGYAAIGLQLGKHTRFGELYPAGNPAFFGKASGLGDVELICNPAPIQVGNRVWIDTNGNGVQDPTEAGVAGVTVQLTNSAGAVIATKITDSTGNYYFSSADGVEPNSTYNVRLGNASDFATGGALAGFGLTVDNAGADSTDSDGVPVNGVAQITFITGKAGENNHSLDFGFSALTCVESNLTDVSATVDGAAKVLFNLSNKASRSLKSAKARGCRVGLSTSSINNFASGQNNLHLDVWTAAWQLPASTFNCPVLPNSCNSLDIQGYKAELLGDVTTLFNQLNRVLNNRCISNRPGTKQIRKAARREFNSASTTINSLSNTIVSCGS